MADALLIPTTADATSIDFEEVTYTPDPWGRFTLPGSLAAELLATGAWKVWAPEDAPAFGPWVPLLPTLAEATDQELFPCFVGDTLGSGLLVGLRYRTVGATQIQFGGTAIYMTGPAFPDDLAGPTPGALIATVPPAAVPVDGGTIALGSSLNLFDGTQTLIGMNPAPATTDNPGEVVVHGWAAGSAIGIAGYVVYDAVPC